MLIPFVFSLLLAFGCASSPIRLITCGGTIDRVSLDDNGIAQFNKSFVPQMLEQSRDGNNITVQHLMAKDSLIMDDADRELVLQTVRNSPEEKIIITHGTDSIVNTSIVLGQNIKDKTVVLLGAMVPFKEEESDALYNIGYAVASVKSLPHGVYVCMQGIAFDWFNVRKNHELGKFQTLTSEDL